MTKLEWVEKQIQIAGEGHENFLGDLKEKFISLIQQAGENLTRTHFWKLFHELRPKDAGNLYCDYMILDTQFCYSADFSEVWDVSKAPLLPEVKGSNFKWGAVDLPADFIKLGGEPDWIQDESFPICETCDCDMALMVQVKSLPYEITKKHEDLNIYTFGDAGTLYIFQCPNCQACHTDWQCY